MPHPISAIGIAATGALHLGMASQVFGAGQQMRLDLGGSQVGVGFEEQGDHAAGMSGCHAAARRFGVKFALAGAHDRATRPCGGDQRAGEKEVGFDTGIGRWPAC